MQVRKVDTSRSRDVRQFIDFPFDLYRECPQWVPPVLPEIRLTLNREKHPFYHHSDADFFVVESRGKTLGRIAVMDNRNYNEYHGRKHAFFYFFESVDDVDVSRALFAAAFDWAHRRGLEQVIGPKGFLQGDGMGTLVEGFEHRPAMGIPYNYPYYEALMQDAGFEKETDFLSGYLRGEHALPQRFYDIADRVKERRGFWIKSFSSQKEMRGWVQRAGQLYNQTFVDNWEYCPLTPQEMDVVADRLLAISDPRLMKLVMKGEEIVGFVFAFPDISAAIQKTGGRVWPLGWVHLLREFKRTKWVNLNGLGLLPEHRGVGANAVLYTELARSVYDFGFEHADVVQIEERNARSLGEMAALGVSWYKRHRIYRRAL
ncbi:MAG: GNAT family N-acetyltransferase [Anaerolineae bacterium]